MAIEVKTNSWPYRHKEPHDPNATLDYQFDWSAWLEEGEIITSALFTVSAGLILEASAFTDATATVWISGGVEKKLETITCRITTNSVPVNRVDDRTLVLLIKER